MDTSDQYIWVVTYLYLWTSLWLLKIVLRAKDGDWAKFMLKLVEFAGKLQDVVGDE